MFTISCLLSLYFNPYTREIKDWKQSGKFKSSYITILDLGRFEKEWNNTSKKRLPLCLLLDLVCALAAFILN